MLPKIENNNKQILNNRNENKQFLLLYSIQYALIQSDKLCKTKLTQAASTYVGVLVGDFPECPRGGGVPAVPEVGGAAGQHETVQVPEHLPVVVVRLVRPAGQPQSPAAQHLAHHTAECNQQHDKPGTPKFLLVYARILLHRLKNILTFDNHK